MSKVQMVRELVEQRLTAAAEEIIGLFERTIAEYEEELCGQQKLLDAVLNPQLQLHRAGTPQLLVSKEVVCPKQQEERPSVDQDDPEPPHIKEEKEELWISQEEEQLQGLEEADITFSLTQGSVKSEDDEEKPQSSWFHERRGEEKKDAEHLETDTDGEDCGGSEPITISDPGNPLQPATDDTSSDSDPETEDSSDWDKTDEPQSGSDSLQNNKEPVSDEEWNSRKTSHRATKRAGNFGHNNNNLQEHAGTQTGKKLFSCSACCKTFAKKSTLRGHSKAHSGKTRYTCRICKLHFCYSVGLERHMRIHTGEKPFSCSVCDKTFVKLSYLKQHSSVHTGVTKFSCSICRRKFAKESYLKQHLLVHTGEKPFGCSVCGKKFTHQCTLKRHVTLHTGERFTCNVCNKKFTRLYNVKSHKCVGESSENK